MKKSLKVSILVDNPSSWFNSYLGSLFKVVRRYDPHFCFLRDAAKLKKRDILFILSCDRLLIKKQLSFHRSNIVIHASDLPKGRGWSPWVWQVEAGKNKIPITMFEAVEKCDAGDYYFKDVVRLDGTELIDDIRDKLAKKIIDMAGKYLAFYPMKAKSQRGRPSYFKKRTRQNNLLDINKSIKSQFNKMRVADNQKYPLYFKFKKMLYRLKIYKTNY